MSTFKVDSIAGEVPTDVINLPNKFKVGGNTIEQGYTTSATEPSSANEGDFWLDTNSNQLYRYINGVWKKIGLGSVYNAGANYGDRGFSVSAYAATNQIARLDITTTGNMVDHADLDVNRKRTATCSNGTYCFAFGGNTTPAGNGVQSTSPSPYNSSAFIHTSISYWESATTNNAADFGDCSTKSQDGAAVSDGITGAHATSDKLGNDSVLNTIDKHTLATPANATDFGDLTVGRAFLSDTSAANATRGVFAAGLKPPNYQAQNIIDYITIATPGNATDFGDLTGTRYGAAGAGAGSGDRGLFFGGVGAGGYNKIDYITLSTTGNASDFGDNTSNSFATVYGGAMNNATRAIHLLGDGNISYVTMATTGNATDFGDQLDTSTSSVKRYVEGVSGNAS